MPGIVFADCMGGDYTMTIVDDELWEQIKSLPDDMSAANYSECILYLTLSDITDMTPPKGCPGRVGKVIAEVHLQDGVIEQDTCGFRGIVAIQLT